MRWGTFPKRVHFFPPKGSPRVSSSDRVGEWRRIRCSARARARASLLPPTVTDLKVMHAEQAPDTTRLVDCRRGSAYGLSEAPLLYA